MIAVGLSTPFLRITTTLLLLLLSDTMSSSNSATPSALEPLENLADTTSPSTPQHLEPTSYGSNSASVEIPPFSSRTTNKDDDTNNNDNNGAVRTTDGGGRPSSFHNRSAMEAATAMNSIAFLKQLVAGKSTSDEVFYQEEDTGGGGDGAVARGMTMQARLEQECRLDDGGESASCAGRRMMNTCEYTGRLWFIKSSVGIRFRETVRICHDDVPPGETEPESVSVECLTRYKHKDDWFDCSKVICRFTIPSPNSDEEDGSVLSRRKKKKKLVKGKTIITTTNTDAPLVMHMDSEILFRAPLFGISGAVKEKIIRTFGSAAEDFYDRLYDTK